MESNINLFKKEVPKELSNDLNS